MLDSEEKVPRNMAENRMTVRFFQDELAQKYRDYVSNHEINNYELFNAVVELLFSGENKLDPDPLENMRQLYSLQNSIPDDSWAQMVDIKKKVTQSPLTAKATITDIILDQIRKGLLESSD